MDGLTGSAASELAAVAHANRRARFVGEETGGGYAMDTSGPQIDLVLPNTKLRISIPTVQYQLAVPDAFPHRGLVPDVLVAPSIEDLLAGRDPQLARALALLEESDPR